MKFQLDSSHENYIVMEVSGLIEKTELICAMSELLNHPEYPSKHTFWDLSQAGMGLSIGDLREIIGVLALYKPEKKNFADKSAILVPGQMNRAMGELFVTMAKALPFRYKVFNSREQAASYLVS